MAYPVQKLKESGYDVTVFFFNPNISPAQEYKRRRDELIKYAKHTSCNYIIEEENHENWLEYIKGYEQEPEKGARCSLCFKYRLEKTVKKQ